jgi:predicted methyltransferase
VLEAPVPRLFTVFGVLDAERIALDLPESVEVKLTNKGAEVVVLQLKYGGKGEVFCDAKL